MKFHALILKDGRSFRYLHRYSPDLKKYFKGEVPLINKTIVSTLCVTAVLITLIIVKAESQFIYACLGLIAALNGVSIWKANHKPKE